MLQNSLAHLSPLVRFSADLVVVQAAPLLLPSGRGAKAPPLRPRPLPRPSPGNGWRGGEISAALPMHVCRENPLDPRFVHALRVFGATGHLWGGGALAGQYWHRGHGRRFGVRLPSRRQRSRGSLGIVKTRPKSAPWVPLSLNQQSASPHLIPSSYPAFQTILPKPFLEEGRGSQERKSPLSRPLNRVSSTLTILSHL